MNGKKIRCVDETSSRMTNKVSSEKQPSQTIKGFLVIFDKTNHSKSYLKTMHHFVHDIPQPMLVLQAFRLSFNHVTRNIYLMFNSQWVQFLYPECCIEKVLLQVYFFLFALHKILNDHFLHF